MASSAPNGEIITSAVPQIERFRWFFSFRIGGDLRFISHHDTLRMFRRAIARADLPVRFSGGFNPQPRINLPLPRPVGVASDDEALVIETDRPIDPEDALQRLQRQMPEGLQLRTVRRLEASGGPHPATVRYRLEAEAPVPADLAERVAAVMASTSLAAERPAQGSKPPRTIDIRPYIEHLSSAGETIEFTLRITGSGTARPAEIAGLLGLDANFINHRIQRLEVQWQ